MATTPAKPKPDLSGYVTCDPDILGGKPCIAGTRVRVQDIYSMRERQDLPIDEIVGAWPHITHAQVYAALAYAWEHRDEVLRLLREEHEFAAKLRQQSPSLTEKARARCNGQGA